MDNESIPFASRLTKAIAESGWEDWTAKLIALVIIGLAGSLALWIWKKVWPRFRTLWDGSRRVNRALAAVDAKSGGIWIASSLPLEPPTDFANTLRISKPIITVANLKGGVGKTTVAANLIAHYAIKKVERVLGIDLDFQGSLTAIALSEHDRNQLLIDQSDGGLSKAAKLIDDRDAQWLHAAPDPINNVPRAKIIPTYYSLAAIENKVMIEWLLEKRTTDIRYHLARLLHDPLIQNSFDRIIIDAPPRLTTACIQALCASTHVLIPTVLDDLSTEAVGAFADQLRIHQTLWPSLKIVGIVGTMTARAPLEVAGPELNDVEVDAHAAGRLALEQALLTSRSPLREGKFYR